LMNVKVATEIWNHPKNTNDSPKHLELTDHLSKGEHTMKNLILLFIAALMLVGCAEEKTINGVTYEPYGLFDQADHKNPNIRYEVDVPNVVWSVLLCSTVVVPLVVIGWDLYEPVGVLDPNYIPH
jgi:hypothetical protein